MVICEYTDCTYNKDKKCCSCIIHIGGINYAFRHIPCSQFTMQEEET